MADYDDTNRGVLFYELEKKSEKAPDFTGTVNVNGKEWRLAGWERTSKNGKNFISIAVSEPNPRETGQAWEAQRQKYKPDVELKDISDEPIRMEDIPF